MKEAWEMKDFEDIRQLLKKSRSFKRTFKLDIKSLIFPMIRLLMNLGLISKILSQVYSVNSLNLDENLGLTSKSENL